MPASSSSQVSQGPAAPRQEFYRVGKRLCADFANTVRAPGIEGDPLGSWADLINFLREAGIVGQAQWEQLRLLASSEAVAAEAAFRTALTLRTALRQLLEAISTGHPVLPESVEPINVVLRWTEGHDELVPARQKSAGDSAWCLGLVARERRLEWLLAAIARSAAELVVEGPGAPVRKCANPACVLYFYDTSRTRRRRWCSMAVCGNRSKVATHAHRAQQARKAGGE